jgi:hypothetical protein
MKSLRIAFAGASGTGKTTLSKWISETYGLPLNPVGSRSVAKSMGFDNPYDVDKAGKRAEFQRQLVTQKRQWEDAHEAFVTDRTTLDNLAYTIFHDIEAVDQDWMDEVLAGLRRYTHILICPSNVFCDLGDDPNRVSSRVYHELYDIVIRALILRYNQDAKVKVIYRRGLERRKAYLVDLMDRQK